MNDIQKAMESLVSDTDLAMMAKHANISPDELKAKLLDAVQNPDAVAVPAPKLSDMKTQNSCHSQSFEVSLFKIIGVSGTLTLCGESSSDWSAELKACLMVAGSEVWCTTYKFDAHNLGVCFSPSVGIAKAKLCFNLQLSGDKACLNINGNACVWAFGWTCGDFDTTVFCLPLP